MNDDDYDNIPDRPILFLERSRIVRKEEERRLSMITGTLFLVSLLLPIFNLMIIRILGILELRFDFSLFANTKC